MPYATITTKVYLPEEDYVMLREVVREARSADISYWRNNFFSHFSDEAIVNMFNNLSNMGLVTTIHVINGILVVATDVGKKFVEQVETEG